MRNRCARVLACSCALAAAPGFSQKTAPRPVVDDTTRRLHATKIEIGDATYEPLLLRGFYESVGYWRWTAKKFAVLLSRPAGRETVYLVLDFGLPRELTSVWPNITITARVNGTEIARRRYSKNGSYQFVAPIPETALHKNPAEVEFELDHTFTQDARQAGINAVSIAFEHTNDAAFDRTAEIARAREGYEYLLAKRGLTVPLEKQQDMMKLFHEVPIWKEMFFQNVQIEKNPLDLWMMQQIIYETRPDVVIETGTWKGGSALYWAYTLQGLGLEQARVLTVDIQDMHATAAAHPLWKKYVTFFHGSSTDPDIVAKISAIAKGKKVLVTLDSDHRMAHVIKEMEAYAPLVNTGSYLVVEDTHMDGVPTAPDFGPGPLAAVRKFLDDGGSAQFEPDLTREAFIMTFNPGGWLKRKP